MGESFKLIDLDDSNNKDFYDDHAGENRLESIIIRESSDLIDQDDSNDEDFNDDHKGENTLERIKAKKKKVEGPALKKSTGLNIDTLIIKSMPSSVSKALKKTDLVILSFKRKTLSRNHSLLVNLLDDLKGLLTRAHTRAARKSLQRT